jgi:uncharacterized damage-inducible protein DinB
MSGAARHLSGLREVDRIQDQLRRSLQGEAWHGPALNELLADVAASEAAAKPLSGTHSIWEIVLHVIAWGRIVCDGFIEKENTHAKRNDWPTPPTKDEIGWKQTIAELNEVHDQLLEFILQLDDSRLEQAAVEGSASAYIVLHGLIQHNLYHAGQIALLKKAVRSDA